MVDAVRHYPWAFDFEAVSEDANPYGRAELRVVGVGYGVDERFSNCLERVLGVLGPGQSVDRDGVACAPSDEAHDVVEINVGRGKVNEG